MNKNNKRFKNTNEPIPRNSSQARGNTRESRSDQQDHNSKSMEPRLSELRSQFEELQRKYRDLLPNVDPSLLNDLLLRESENPGVAPIYKVEVFLEPGLGSQQIRDTVLKDTGIVPAIYDKGTHITAHHRLTIELLKQISEKKEVIEITGQYNGESQRGITI